jgi:hypothetical protein
MTERRLERPWMVEEIRHLVREMSLANPACLISDRHRRMPHEHTDQPGSLRARDRTMIRNGF